MKYLPKYYAQAFLECAESAPSTRLYELARNFVRVVAKNGDFSRMSKILEAISLLETKKNGGRHVFLEFARELPSDFVERVRRFFPERDRVEVRVRPALIAGLRVTIDGEEELDSSVNKKIKNLFQIR